MLLRMGWGRNNERNVCPSDNPRGCRTGRKAHGRSLQAGNSTQRSWSSPSLWHHPHLKPDFVTSTSLLAEGKQPAYQLWKNTCELPWHSPDCWERCPLPFFFFSFFSFGLAKLKRRVGIWVCSSAALLVWFVVLSKWKVLFSLCVLERLFLLGETDSSASKCPCLGREGLFCMEDSSMLDWEETLASFSCRFET